MNYPRYTAVFLGMAIGVALIVMAANAWLDAGLGSSAQLLAPAMVAALIEGRAFVREEGRKPNMAEAWNFALLATALAVVLNVALSYAMAALLPEFAKLTIAEFGSRQFLILLALYALGYLLSNRFFLSIGARSEQDAISRRNGVDKL
ncbi:ABZJ_00895 family protein [Roseovarius dicentrarchi]|uniref:ABZJ_00895 family protein n=1 Tax=Roseovarius dicentrarchi TaxID=2250573 RepID=UPI000DEA6A8C|nr:ABZJ_00895 family protein [Roseovarius dicentrarchi]